MRVELSFTYGLSVTRPHRGRRDHLPRTRWEVGALAVGRARRSRSAARTTQEYTGGHARSLGADQPDPDATNDQTTWYGGPSAPGNPVPVVQIAAGRVLLRVRHDDGVSGDDTVDAALRGRTPTLAGAGQADVVVAVTGSRATTVPGRPRADLHVAAEKRNTDATVTGLQLSVPIPAGTRLIRAEAGDGSYDPVAGVWRAGDLKGKATVAKTLG